MLSWSNTRKAFAQYQAFAFLLASRAVLAITAFIGIRVLSSKLENAEIEVLGQIQAIVGFWSLMFLFPIGTYLNQNILNLLEARKFSSLVKNYFSLILLVAALIFTVTVYSNSVPIALGVICFFVGQGTLQFLLPLLNISGYVVTYAMYTAIYAVLALCLSLILIVFVTPSAVLWVVGQSSVFIFIAFAAYFHLLTLFPKQENAILFYSASNARTVMRFSLPLLILSCANWAFSFSPRILPSIANPSDDYSSYVIFGALSLGILGIVEVLISQWYGPKLLRGVHQFDDRADYFPVFEKYWTRCTGLLSITLLIIILFKDIILSIAVDAKFSSLQETFILFLMIDYLRILAYFSFQIFNLLYVGRFITYSLSAAVTVLLIIIGVLFQFEIKDAVSNLLFLIIAFQSFFVVFIGVSYRIVKGSYVSQSC